jgi:hypothetical protein
MALEASIEMEELGNGWWARASVRVLGRDLTARSREFKAGSYSALFQDITAFLDGLVPAEPAKKRVKVDG